MSEHESQTQEPAPPHVLFQVVVTVRSDNAVLVNGPIQEHKDDVLKALAAGLQSVLNYEPQPKAGIVLASQVPPVPPALQRRRNGPAGM